MKYTILAILAIILAACSGSQAAQQPTPMAKPTIAPTPTPEPHLHVGQSTIRDGFKITLNSVKLVDPASIPQHDQLFPDLKSDKTFIVLDESAENVTTKDQKLMGMYLVFQDTEGSRNFTSYANILPDVDGVGLGGPIAPGMKQHGTQDFAVPKATHDFNWMYEATTGTQVVWDIHV